MPEHVGIPSVSSERMTKLASRILRDLSKGGSGRMPTAAEAKSMAASILAQADVGPVREELRQAFHNLHESLLAAATDATVLDEMILTKRRKTRPDQ